MHNLSFPPGLGAKSTAEAQGEQDGVTQPMLMRCLSCFSSSNSSLGVSLYCRAAFGRAPGNKSMSISNPVAAVFGGGGPNVPPVSLCLSITLLRRHGRGRVRADAASLFPCAAGCGRGAGVAGRPCGLRRGRRRGRAVIRRRPSGG